MISSGLYLLQRIVFIEVEIIPCAGGREKDVDKSMICRKYYGEEWNRTSLAIVKTCKASITRLRMWVIIQEPKSGEAWVLFSQKKVLLSASAGGAIKTYECGLARWALPPGSSLLVAREGGDIRVN